MEMSILKMIFPLDPFPFQVALSNVTYYETFFPLLATFLSPSDTALL